MVPSRFSTHRDLEIADMRSLLQGPDRPLALHLLTELYDGLLSRNLPESDVEDFDELVARLDEQPIQGPAACLMIVGRKLLENDPEILAFGLADYYPRSRCAMILALEREARMSHLDIWHGTRTITEVLRESLVDRVEQMAGLSGLRGVFTECRDPDAEGLTDPDQDSEMAISLARSGRERRRMRCGQLGWELVAVPIDYVRPAFGFGGSFPGKILLCICADSLRRLLPDRETIRAFVLELWTALAGRPPSKEDEAADRMMRQLAAI